MTNCYFCQKEIKGKPFDRDVPICHPATTYDTVKICSQCHHFPKNSVESKETLIK